MSILLVDDSNSVGSQPKHDDDNDDDYSATESDLSSGHSLASTIKFFNSLDQDNSFTTINTLATSKSPPTTLSTTGKPVTETKLLSSD